MRRSTLSLGVLALGVLAVAASTAALSRASAVAARVATTPTLWTTPFTYKGYSWTLQVSGQGAQASLTISAIKQVGSASQMHVYSFRTGVRFTVDKNLSTAHLTASLGSFGTMKAAFRASGKLAARSLPAGCTGPKFLGRSGSLTGFAFVADTTFFKKVAKTPVNAALSRPSGPGQINCAGTGAGTTPKPTAGTVALMGTRTEAPMLSVMASRSASGAVTEVVTVNDRRGTATIMHMITSRAPTSAFTTTTDLSSATVTGVAPFLSGTLTFTSSGGYGSVATGTLSGSFTARFDSIGAQTPASTSPLQGTLMHG